ncbi:hypothetical protein NLU13_0591 [Sarocladium strictum]|uniref:Uncharacterized protein n=1 Tax=Sarocladium strictum TaxID=5046 RepID=A0AA39GR83_SARSR|nr:hypothetical protein NLU13_0591 [Sarocladium strictum]
MDVDANHSRQSSQDYDYTVDGGIPDAQFDEAMNSFLDDALEADFDLKSQQDVILKDPPRGGKLNDQDDSDYVDEDGDAEDHDGESNVSPAPSHSSEPENAEDDHQFMPQSPTTSLVKRYKSDLVIDRPFKRRCTELSVGYVDLLNKEIKEAALRGCTEDKDVDEDGVAAYRASQLGLIIWSPVEKRTLYETTSRLGRSAVADISAAIGTKSVVEVEDYLSHLHYASEDRKSKLRPILQPAERPAAMELSPQCCHALDEAADTLSIMQERREQRREEEKWGSSWNFTQAMFEEAHEEDTGRPLDERTSDLGDLFDIPKWLALSSDIFMNSAVPSNNWNYVDEEPPTIWATALEDFYSLTVSVTRRLVQTTLYVAMSRLRTKREAEPRLLNVVRREDVEAALQSLNMEDKRSEFWRGCARRLRLNVRDNESAVPPEQRREESNSREHMTFDEVEAALGDEGLENRTLADPGKPPDPPHPDDHESTPDGGMTENEADVDSAGQSDSHKGYSAEELAVRNEAEEVILYSGVDFPQSTRSKEVLLNRISGERRQEDYANQCDQQASREEEVKMWELLEKPVPQNLRVRETPEQVPRTHLGVEGVYSVGRNWRRALHHFSEWETQEDGDERN